MKQLQHLYRNNPVVTIICDGIALLVCASTAILVITLFTVACTL